MWTRKTIKLIDSNFQNKTVKTKENKNNLTHYFTFIFTFWIDVIWKSSEIIKTIKQKIHLLSPSSMCQKFLLFGCRVTWHCPFSDTRRSGPEVLISQINGSRCRQSIVFQLRARVNVTQRGASETLQGIKGCR